MTREEMIEECIRKELEVNCVDQRFLRGILRDGLKGYNNLSDEEIEKIWRMWYDEE